MEELTDVCTIAVVAIMGDADLCGAHPRICAYAVSPEWRARIAESMARHMLDMGSSNPYDAAEVVETQLEAND